MENGNNQLNACAIRIEDLSVHFHGRSIISHLSLEVCQGGPTFLLGRSGSGKTTLLRAVNRLNECFPGCQTSGRIGLRLGGAWVEAYASGTPVEELRRQAGMVFQSPNVLPLSIERNMLLPLKTALDLPAEACFARMEHALREVHLWVEVRDRLASPAATL